MSDTRVCTTCGAEFEGRSDARFCSSKCRQAAYRDRSASDCQLSLGGVTAPVSAFEAETASFGVVGSATITASNLRGDPQRDSSGHLTVEITVSGETLWRGDAVSISRNLDSGSVTVKGAGGEARLARQTWATGTFESLTVSQFLEAAAHRSGLAWCAGSPLDGSPLLRSEIPPGPCSALDLIRLSAREHGADPRVINGELVLALPAASEPRSIGEARNIHLSTYGSAMDCIAVVCRSHLPMLVGGKEQILLAGSVAAVPPGVPVYILHVHNYRQHQVDALRERLGAELAAALLAVQCEVDDPSIVTGSSIRMAATGERALTVTRVNHAFSAEAGLTTRIEALYLPPPPVIEAGRGLPVRVVYPGGLAA